MSKYFKIAVCESRPLQYKNCFDWVLVRFEESTGLCYFKIGNKLNVLSLKETIEFHKKATSRKPYKIKTVCIAEFYGYELAIIDYAAENKLNECNIPTFEQNALIFVKKWPGYNLKPINNLNFLNKFY